MRGIPAARCAAIFLSGVALWASTQNFAQSPASVSEEGAQALQLATDVFETIAKVPVTVQPIFGDPRTGDMIVTHFKPPGEGPFPIVIFHHGRGMDRSTPSRFRFLNVVRYWTRRGAAVFVPTRLGYGETGLEPDPEETGPCNNKRYEVAAASVGTQSLAAIAFAKSQSWTDKNRVVIMGQSMGGFTTIVTMSHKVEGVIAGINFAGGGGGDPLARKEDPCSYGRMGSVFADAAKANGGASPMIWLYSKNDLYWGESIPRKWHEAYVSAGGKAHFEMFGPVGNDGHRLLSEGVALWRPVLDKFIAPLGFKPPATSNAPKASSFAPLDDATKLPLVRDDVKKTGYLRFLNSDLPRAFAIGPKGEWNFRSGENSMTRALELCAATAKTACKLYAVDDAVVWVE